VTTGAVEVGGDEVVDAVAVVLGGVVTGVADAVVAPRAGVMVAPRMTLSDAAAANRIHGAPRIPPPLAAFEGGTLRLGRRREVLDVTTRRDRPDAVAARGET
jgi:hypothetical protein